MTAYTPELREQAFVLWAQGVPDPEIERRLHITRMTLWRWQKKYNWEKLKEDIIDKLEEDAAARIGENLQKEVKRINDRHQQSISNMYGLAMSQWSRYTLRMRDAANHPDEPNFNILKSLKITTEIMMMLIDKERQIRGIGLDIGNENVKSPSEYVFRMVDGFGNPLDTQAVERALPDQDPHHFELPPKTPASN